MPYIHNLRNQDGFTLAELMIVIVIVALLSTGALTMLRNQVDRGIDVQRKGELVKLRRVLEEYYADHECYPPQSALMHCGGSDLAPYSDRVLCDPAYKTPYFYHHPSSNQCGGYVLCTTLHDKTDPDIAKIGCAGEQGCGWVGGYNYCISNGGQVLGP